MGVIDLGDERRGRRARAVAGALRRLAASLPAGGLHRELVSWLAEAHLRGAAASAHAEDPPPGTLR